MEEPLAESSERFRGLWHFGISYKLEKSQYLVNKFTRQQLLRYYFAQGTSELKPITINFVFAIFIG